MTEFEGQVLADLRVLKAQMDHVMGVGQPGRLHKLEERVDRQESGMQRLRGMGAALGVVLTAVHVAISWFAERR
jgi:hypothetical protein